MLNNIDKKKKKKKKNSVTLFHRFSFVISSRFCVIINETRDKFTPNDIGPLLVHC